MHALLVFRFTNELYSSFEDGGCWSTVAGNSRAVVL